MGGGRGGGEDGELELVVAEYISITTLVERSVNIKNMMFCERTISFFVFQKKFA